MFAAWSVSAFPTLSEARLKRCRKDQISKPKDTLSVCAKFRGGGLFRFLGLEQLWWYWDKVFEEDRMWWTKLPKPSGVIVANRYQPTFFLTKLTEEWKRCLKLDEVSTFLPCVKYKSLSFSACHGEPDVAAVALLALHPLFQISCNRHSLFL